MFRTFYRGLVPRIVREELYNSHIQSYTSEELRRVRAIDEAIPKVELNEVHIKNLRVVVDRIALLDLLPKNSVVAEIGVDRGDFSAQISCLTNPSKLYLIDSWAGDTHHERAMDVVRTRFQEEITRGQVIIARGNSVPEMEKFDDGSFDWVYVDADHSYENIRKDLDVCMRKVRPGGIIAGHDYTLGNWVDRIRYGVVEAVNEFCVKNNWEMIILTHEAHRHLSYALKEIVR